MASLRSKVTTAEQAVGLLSDGMTVGMSGFTRAGDSKAMPVAMAARATSQPFQITLLTGASLGNDSDAMMASAGLIKRRSPFQVDTVMRKKINEGEIMFCDAHLSQPAETLRAQTGRPIDVAIIEAVASTETGVIIPTTSVGNSASFVAQAKQVIVEINLSMPLALEGLHDIYLPEARPGRQPIALTDVDQRIGETAIQVE